MNKTMIIVRIILSCVLAVALTVSCLVYSIAWMKTRIETPYVFEIHANGVLYVYVESQLLENEDSLYPAIAMPGAVAEGLHMDVLKSYNELDANPSYISKTATVTTIKGEFSVYNEGFGLEPVPLPHDEEGYTLYPKVDKDGNIIWKDSSDHSKGWETMRMPADFKIDPINGTMSVTEWSKDDGYEPLLNDDDEIVWITDVTLWNYNYEDEEENEDREYWVVFDSDSYELKKVPRDGSAECLVYLDLQFKASDNDELDDYYDSRNFIVKRLYLTTEDEDIPEGTGLGPVYHNSGVIFDTLSNDNTSATYTMYGPEKYFLHAEVYLAQPDELLDPELRGNEVYLRIGVRVAVTQVWGS